MTRSANEAATLIFRRVEGIDFSEHGLSINLFNIIGSLDGQRNIQTIADEDGYDFDDLHRKVSRLHAMGLIESVGRQSRYASRQIMKQLANHLSKSVGPIAGILIEDMAMELGCTSHRMPLPKLGELIRRMAEKISDRKQAEEFIQKAMSLVS